MDPEGAIPQQATDDEGRTLTRPGGLPGFTLQDRVLGLEWWRLEIERRLVAGVTQFTELKNGIGALQPKPRSFVSILPFLIPVIILAGTMLWQAARYPDRREFESLKTELSAIRVEQAQTSAKLDLLVRESKP